MSQWLRLHRHHRLALIILAAAICIGLTAGAAYAHFEGLALWRGWYCALANGVTVGGDVTPHNGAGYGINVFECVTIAPLIAAAFGLFTSGLVAGHTDKVGQQISASEDRIKAHVDNVIADPPATTQE